MIVVKYWCVVVISFCVIILWLTFLYVTNNYYSPKYVNNKLLQYRSLETKPTKLTRKLELLNDTLVDLDSFKFVMNNPSLCVESTTSDSHSSLVIMVHTARHNFDRRYTIRSTWGSIKSFRQWRFHLIFLLGKDPTNDPEDYTESRLWDESNEYGDLIMGNFVDSYRNLTYKHLMGYKWVSTFCPSAKYILKTDDDIYADIFQITEVLLMELINSGKAYACENMGGNKPDRRNNSKWYAPKEMFAEDIYPDFCSGSAYLVRAEDASKIYSISNRTTFFWVDDVFVTGVLREKYDKITGSNKSLEILSLYDRHHLSDKKDIIRWCSKGLSTSQLNHAFILLDDDDFIKDMFCIWNKIRLMRFAMNVE